MKKLLLLFLMFGVSTSFAGSDDTEVTFGWLILIIGLAVLFLVIQYHFLRYVFSIKKQLENQRQQLSVLIKIAEKSGAVDDELVTIKDEMYRPKEKGGFFDI